MEGPRPDSLRPRFAPQIGPPLPPSALGHSLHHPHRLWLPDTAGRRSLERHGWAPLLLQWAASPWWLAHVGLGLAS
jgi:hypothetical protein